MNRTEDKCRRRPPNPFLLFSNEKRKQLILQNPELGNRDISKILGHLWAQLGPNERNEYIKRAAIIRTELLTQNPEYRFNPWTVRRLKEQKRIERPLHRHQLKSASSASNVIIWRATDRPTGYAQKRSYEQPIPQASGPSAVPSLPKEETMTDEKQVFLRLLGLCRKDSKEYINIQTKRILNYKMFECIQLSRNKPKICSKLQSKDHLKVKRPRGRPRKDSKALPTKPVTYGFFESYKRY